MTENPQAPMEHRGFAYDAETHKWVKGNYSLYIPSPCYVEGLPGMLIWFGEWRGAPVCCGASVDATIDHLERFDSFHEAGDETCDAAGEIKGKVHCMGCGETSETILTDFKPIGFGRYRTPGISGRGKCPICGRGVFTILPSRYRDLL